MSKDTSKRGFMDTVLGPQCSAVEERFMRETLCYGIPTTSLYAPMTSTQEVCRSIESVRHAGVLSPQALSTTLVWTLRSVCLV